MRGGGGRGQFYSDEITGKIFDLKILKRLLAYFSPYKFTVFASVVFLLSASLIELIGPYLFKVGIDDHIAVGDYQGLKRIALLYFIVVFSSSVLSYIQMIITRTLGQNVVYDIRSKLYRHLTGLSMNYFTTNPSGRLTTRVTNDIESLNELFTAGFIGIFGDIFTIIFIFAILIFKMDLKLTLISMTVVPAIILAVALFRKAIQPVFLKVRKTLAELNAYFAEIISGVKVIKSFVQEVRILSKLRKKNSDYTEANKRSVLVHSIFHPTMEILDSLAMAIIIWYGGYRILDLTLSPGVLIAFLIYVQRIYRPINDLAQKFNILQSAIASSARIFSILDSNDLIPDKGTIEKKECDMIEFKKVNFSYGKEHVLKDLDLSLKKGEKIALVGYTGSGKTTIINLLFRFWDIDSGNILIDGNDIREFRLKELRSRFGLVPQDIYLFEGTVYNNIILDDDTIPFEKVEQASREIGLLEVLDKFEHGLHHKVTESGKNLSLGERQLISFARVLVYDPDILILDEPTSNIDTETEELIQNALMRILAGRSAIMIAHRLSTIKKADRILVLSHGRIVEEGTHDFLIREKGLYYKLYLAQS